MSLALFLADDGPLEALLFVGLTFLLTTGLMVWIVRLHAKRWAQREKHWRDFALEHRFEIRVEPRTFLKHGTLRMRGEVGGLELEFSTYTVKQGKSHVEWAKLRARGRGPAASLHVRNKNLLDFIGGKKPELGDAAFDKRFVVRSEPADFGREVLVPEMREDLLAYKYEVQFAYSDGECELSWRGGMETREQLARAVELQARLFGGFARSGRAGL